MSSVQTKYIIFSTKDKNKNLNNVPDGNEVPIIFPNNIDHIVMADAMLRIGLTPVSAGFCFINKDKHYSVRGKSESLNLGIREGDENILGCYLSGG